ncbi:CRTAC1 family protein [Acuticoccus sp. MNP-M23]|uniref:CRTAC1 family protein n=1 Tax=Acuticoccus sp. MNP-M23 TaxID=3072793 RepID=UPI0028162224|nr:CRTAC1 family protein [Acuticoccus sp. MNP-M23]WMS40896.1 CRTAC1 family protein [Acuticoccus sp. MNP-M23]
MRGAALLLILAATPALAGPAVPDFVDASAALPGPPHVYDGDWEHYVGGGVAVLDCNGDNRLDLVAAGGTNPARLFINRSEPGRLVFGAGAPLPADLRVTGLWPVDIDSDGVLDLALTRVGPNALLRGAGDCTFSDASDAWSFARGNAWSTAFSATFEPDARWPTLAIGNYVDRDDPAGPFEACDDNVLFRPSGEGYGPPQILTPGYCALSILFSDYRRRGRADLRLSNDRHYYVRGGSEQMLEMPGARFLTAADGWDRLSIWGMGIASEDFTGDGLPEVVLTSMGDQLMMIAGPDGYEMAPFEIGTFAQRPFFGDDGRPSTGWHAQFADVNNDGLSDLFIAKGNVDQMPTNAIADPNNLLLQREDGRFEEAADRAGIATTARARGAALADFDRDGALDLVVVNRRAPLELYRSAGPGGRSVAITPRQSGANPFAIGAFVDVIRDGTAMSRELTVGGGHGGGIAGPVYVGLGDAPGVTVRITWPDGSVSPETTLQAGADVVLMRDGDGIAVSRRD